MQVQFFYHPPGHVLLFSMNDEKAIHAVVDNIIYHRLCKYLCSFVYHKQKIKGNGAHLCCVAIVTRAGTPERRL